MTNPVDPAPDDAALVRAIQRDGAESAMSVLYDRHTPRAYQTACRILGGDVQRAEDAMQEAWMRALARLDSWRESQAFGAWLRGIAAHVAIDLLRRERLLDFAPDIDASIEAVAEHIDLEDAIAALAPGYRAVLVLHDVEGFTHEEIGERLGITAGTSKGQLFKARRAVRARLSPEPAEEIQ